MMPAKIEAHVHRNRTACDQRRHQIGKELRHDELALHQQAVHVIALRHTLARLRTRRDLIPLDQGDTIEVIREHARCQQAGEPSTDDDRVRPCV
jgi:hypothetical protein